MLLRPFLIPKGHYTETKVLRTLLFPKGQKKDMKRRIACQHKLEGEERKSSRQLNKNFWCDF